MDGQETIPLTIEKCIISSIQKIEQGIIWWLDVCCYAENLGYISLSSKMNLALLPTLKDIQNRHILLI